MWRRRVERGVWLHVRFVWQREVRARRLHALHGGGRGGARAVALRATRGAGHAGRALRHDRVARVPADPPAATRGQAGGRAGAGGVRRDVRRHGPEPSRDGRHRPRRGQAQQGDVGGVPRPRRRLPAAGGRGRRARPGASLGAQRVAGCRRAGGRARAAGPVRAGGGAGVVGPARRGAGVRRGGVPSRPGGRVTEMSRPFPVERMLRGQEVTVAAAAAELPAIAARLQIPRVHALTCRWVLRPGPGGRVAAEGALRARVEQECVVSLDPFPVTVEHAFKVVFLPAASADAEPDEPDSPDILPYDGPALDLGEAAVEELALALDPFPRKPGATLPVEPVAEATIHPFAALKARRGG